MSSVRRATDFPTTQDGVQRRFGGPDRDVFLVWPSPKTPPSFIGGVTWSSDFPGARTARFGPGGEQEAFIARLRPAP